MQRSFDLRLVPLVAAAFSLSACTPEARADDTVARICTDANGVRVQDAECRRTNVGSGVGAFYAWYYLSRGGRYPALGEVAANGSRAAPAGAKTFTSVSERGGFGATAQARGAAGGKS